MKVAVTGAAGNISARLVPALRSAHEVVGIDLHDADRIADVRDLAATKRALEGCEAVVHLAGIVNNEAPWEPIYETDIGGTYNVYEAARQVGCERIIFASSNHAVGRYEVDFPKPEVYRGQAGVLIGIDAPLRPDGYSGVSKAFGEALGR